MQLTIPIFKYSMASEFAGQIKPGVHEKGNYKPLLQIMGEMGELGYGNVEHAPFIDGIGARYPIEKETLQQIELAKEESGCGISGLHWIMSFLNLVDPPKEGLSIFADGELEYKTQHYYFDLIGFCNQLGGKVSVHGSPPSRKMPEGMSLEEGLEKAKDFYTSLVPGKGKTILDYAEEMNVTIAFEPLGPDETNFINTVKQGIEFAESIDNPYFGVTADVKAMAREKDKSIVEIIRSDIGVGNLYLLAAVHFNDPTKVGPGLGNYDFVPIMEALLDIGWEGPITIEPFTTVKENNIEDCKAIMQYLRTCELRIMEKRAA